MPLSTTPSTSCDSASLRLGRVTLRPKAVMRLRFELMADVPIKDLKVDDLDIYLRFLAGGAFQIL